MFNDVLLGARLKVYVDGGADFTGLYCGYSPTDPFIGLTASNDKLIRIREDAVVAVVAL